MTISIFDNVRVAQTPITDQLGLTGLIGQVYGETRPSSTEVTVIGEVINDYAINVYFEDRSDSLWFAPQLLEFIDHAPGTDVVIGDKKFVRSKDGEWIGDSPKKPWWQYW